MRDRQPPLYLITGIVIGLLVGLFVSYVVLPVRYSDTQPATLSREQRDIYRALVARAYLYEADQARAFSRIALLSDADVGGELVSQAQQVVADSGDALAARGLALLASVLTDPETFITPLAPLEVPETPPVEQTKTGGPTVTPLPATATPFITYTPRPTSTPKPTQGAAFQLVGEARGICESGSPALLMVYVYDTQGKGVSSVRIQVSAPDGSTSDFFTGLYPEISNGYADFEMTNDVVYSLRVGEGGDVIPGLSAPQCEMSDGSVYSGSLELKFKQP